MIITQQEMQSRGTVKNPNETQTNTPTKPRVSTKPGFFLKYFKPYQNKYTLCGKSELLGESYWFTKIDRLTLGLIRKAILEQVVVGWFTTHVPNVLGVDIDDHRGQAWYGEARPSAYLLNTYGQIVSRIGYHPSLLIQSPHGLHAYWVLSERLPAEMLHDKARTRLKDLPVEIKPTPTTSLRIPAERRVLDTQTLQFINQPLEQILQNMFIYHPALILDGLPAEIREDLLTKRRKLRSFRASRRIEEAEKSIHFFDGQSNDAFLELCNVYRCAGLKQEEAVYRFHLKFEQSPLYDGELKHSPRRLLQRIHCEYRKNPYSPKPKAVQVGLFNSTIAERLAAIHPFAKQRTQPIYRFVERILFWADWHDEIIKDPARTAVFDYLYTYYRKNRKAGYYPLPFTILKKANSHYESIMTWLEKVGFIEPAPFTYSKRLHICRYYSFDRARFLDILPRSRMDG